METIFNHKPSQNELRAVLGPLDWSVEDLLGWTQIDNYVAIYRLYAYRGNNEVAIKYANKIPNSIHKIFGVCNHDFANGLAQQ